MKSIAEQKTRVVLLDNKEGRTEQSQRRLKVKKDVHNTLLELREQYKDFSKEIAEEIKWMNNESKFNSPFHEILTDHLDSIGKGLIYFNSAQLYKSKDNRAALSRWLTRCMGDRGYVDIGNYRITVDECNRPRNKKFIAKKTTE